MTANALGMLYGFLMLMYVILPSVSNLLTCYMICYFFFLYGNQAIDGTLAEVCIFCIRKVALSLLRPTNQI